jgi:hypothetical protein
LFWRDPEGTFAWFERDGVRDVKITRSGAALAPGFEEFASLVELGNSRGGIGGSAAAVVVLGGEEVAVGGDNHFVGRVGFVGRRVVLGDSRVHVHGGAVAAADGQGAAAIGG